MEENRKTILTASMVAYVFVYVLVGLGGISFNAQPAQGYVNAPDLPDPSDGSDDQKRYVNVSARFTSPDQSSGTLRFYTSGDTLLDSCSVANNSRCEVNHSLASQLDSAYDWYAVATDGTYTEQSSTWGFTTEQGPYAPSNPDPADGSSGVKVYPNVSAVFSDPDSASGTLEYYTDSDSLIGSCTASDGSRCEVNYSSADQPGTTYSWYAIAKDESASVISSTWSFSTDPAPYAEDPDPADGETGVEIEPNVSAVYRDPDGDTGEMHIYAEDGSLIGSCTGLSDGDRCNKTYSSASTYSTSYDWEVRVYDGNNWASHTWTFETRDYGTTNPEVGRIDISFEDRYTIYNIVKGESQTVPLILSNPEGERDIEVNITNGSSFSSFADGSDIKSFTMGIDEKNLLLNVKPDFEGTRTIKIEATNKELNTVRTAEATVVSSDSAQVGRSSPNEVPGLAWVNLLVITAVSSAYFLLL